MEKQRATTRGYRLREATEDDLDLMARHRMDMFLDMGGHSEAEFPAHARAYKRWARRMMRNGRYACIVAERNGVPVASGCVWLRDRHPSPPLNARFEPYILSMYTSPAHRGKGLARRIVQRLLRWCKERGYQKAVLHAAPMGRGVYARLGFERTWEMRVELSRPTSRASRTRSGSR